ncbi:alpha/beta fold hydrolase [Pseudooceanicola sp.]|uniref:alpha/beta fold hydrolase n=1 Tax=Pseudooceanicola sp. TaxID=1914328 RepID=UPI00262B56E7|nr:alpha/beta fold hydrolase [Pseudooceanicola sp.]MDF1857162.1 alpha/beta fold hydrolase [Pseudooceanicola sp.]
MTLRFIETERGAFRYELTGQGDGPVLVLLHEMGGSLHSWDAVMPVLIKSRRVLRYDIRGYGMSVKVTGRFEMSDWVADLAALLDALAIAAPVDLAGCAFNGGTVLAFAAAHPTRVRKVLAMSPVTEVLAERRAAIAEMSDRMEHQGMAAVIDNIENSYPEYLRTDAAAYAAFRARWLGNDPRSFAESYRMLARLAMMDDLARITCPVLLVGAKGDPLRPPALVTPLQARIAGSDYREVDSGHYLPVQTPEIFLDLADWF